jgi:glycine/serine hydroxymethyltransferase
LHREITEITHKLASIIDRALLGKDDAAALAKIRQEVAEFCKAFPMPH